MIGIYVIYNNIYIYIYSLYLKESVAITDNIMAQRNSQQLKMAATNSNPSRWDRGFLKTCSAP